MDIELLFKIVNASVMPAWVLMMIGPRWLITRVLVHSYLYPFVLGIVYAAIIIPSFLQGGEGDMMSVAGLQVGFQNGLVLVGAWVHYLIFDMFVGAWESRDAQKLGISHWLLLPCLFFTLMLGPVGLMLYLVIRYFHTRKLSIA